MNGQSPGSVGSALIGTAEEKGSPVDLTESAEEFAFRTRARTWMVEHAHEAPTVEVMPGSAEHAPGWRAWSRQLYEAGFVGLTWPAEFGGGGLAPIYQAIWAEEVARAGVPDHIGIVGVNMAGPTIIDHGTPAQKDRFLTATLSGDIVWCQGFSEPGSGSDLASVRTRARLDGDEWVVNGQKVWSSWAHLADWCILLVRTEDDSKPRHRGLTFLLVEMSTPGIEVRPLTQMTGDPEFNEVFYDEVRVPTSLTLGERGAGWAVAMTTLKHERRSLGLGLAGRLSASVEDTRRLLVDVGPDDRRPGDDAGLMDRLADAWVEAESLRALNLRVVSAMAAGEDAPAFGSLTKLRWSEINQRVMTIACDALGGSALVEDADGPRGAWPFLQLRSRGNSIEAGTSEILRNIVAERVLGLPRVR